MNLDVVEWVKSMQASHRCVQEISTPLLLATLVVGNMALYGVLAQPVSHPLYYHSGPSQDVSETLSCPKPNPGGFGLGHATLGPFGRGCDNGHKALCPLSRHV